MGLAVSLRACLRGGGGRGHFSDDGWMATNGHRCAVGEEQAKGAAVGANPKLAFAGNLGNNALSPHIR